METVKMPRAVQAKAGAVSRGSQAEVPDQSQSFVKLLQEKKNMAQPDKAETKTAGKKPDSLQGKDDKASQAGEPEKEVKDKASENAQEADNAEEAAQEALLQAGMWQTAAQLAGMLEDSQRGEEILISPDSQGESAGLVTAETVQAVRTDGVPIPAEVQADDQGGGLLSAADQAVYQAGEEVFPKDLTAQAPEREPETAETPEIAEAVKSAEVRPESSGKAADGPETAVKAADIQEATVQPKAQEALSQEKGEAGQFQNQREASENAGEEIRVPERVRTEDSQVRQDRKAEQEPGQQAIYRTDSVREQSWQPFAGQKAEEIPLRTSQNSLPQDLGKTLAAKFPINGQELVIELEPAALGKLTIKLAYEAGRAAVSILASNPRTLEILSERASEIAGILEEKTGQDTVIYTHAPEQQENQDSERNQGNGGQESRQDQPRQRREDQHQAESFAQQLRLGLI